MGWKKLGLVFNSDHQNEWMWTHASNPVAEQLEGDLFRIYFGCRDRLQRSSIASLSIDINRPNKILHLDAKPLLSPGKDDEFDRDGCSMGSIVKFDDQIYIYYLGWHIATNGYWSNQIGVARKTETAFEKLPQNPIVKVEPKFGLHSLSYPWVLKEDSQWTMWLGAHTRPMAKNITPKHDLWRGHSKDGIFWIIDSEVAIPLGSEDALARPSVLYENNTYKMWYSIKAKNYRLGYAESIDGKSWTRKDNEVGIQVSQSGWDCDDICYAHVFSHRGSKFLLYNGNRYGATGFGLAVFD